MIKWKYITVFVVLILVLAIDSVRAQGVRQDISKLIDSGKKLPSFEAVSLSGDTVNLESVNAKVILIDFWYMGCGPCRESLPSMVRLYDKYRDSGLVIIGMNPFDHQKQDKLRSVVSALRITYPIVLCPNEYPLLCGVDGYPCMYFLDSEKRVFAAMFGFGEQTAAYHETIIRKILSLHK
jgi:thiol-disulfide isomerase/thioredoxin